MKAKRVKSPFEGPRDGDVVMGCKHTPRRGARLHYIGDENGLGLWIKTQLVGNFWCRWVCLCWWCEVVRWIRRKAPLEMVSKGAMTGTWAS